MSQFAVYCFILSGVCRLNVTCDCEGTVQESRRIVEDRNSALFNRGFEDAIIKQVFVKPKDKDDDDEEKKKKKKGTWKWPSKKKESPTGIVKSKGSSKKVSYFVVNHFAL